MGRNHFGLNTYANDVSRQTQDIGANYPFNGLSWKGGKRRGGKARRHRIKTRGRNKKYRGGNVSNFISQDIINLGRQIGYNTSSMVNSFTGQPAPVNPLPWQDQMRQGGLEASGI